MSSRIARAASAVPVCLILAIPVAGAAETAVSEFDELGIVVEQNATDADTEIVIVAVPDTDQGLRRFAVRAPDGRRILTVRSPSRVMGLREFLFETPEPEGEQILSVYPEGRYRFRGIAEDGERFFGTARLSHRLPPATTIIHPVSGQEVPADSLTIQWSQVPGIEQFLLEFENESADPEQSLTINLPPDVTSFAVPPSLLIPGAAYQAGVATVAASGNLVFVEVEFTTSDQP